jgi:hypothetical protein
VVELTRMPPHTTATTTTRHHCAATATARHHCHHHCHSHQYHHRHHHHHHYYYYHCHKPHTPLHHNHSHVYVFGSHDVSNRYLVKARLKKVAWACVASFRFEKKIKARGAAATIMQNVIKMYVALLGTPHSCLPPSSASPTRLVFTAHALTCPQVVTVHDRPLSSRNHPDHAHACIS